MGGALVGVCWNWRNEQCNCWKTSRIYIFLSNFGESTFWQMRPPRTQISLRIRAVWSEFVLSAWRNFVPLAIQKAPIEDSDQTAQMRRLIIFAGRTVLRNVFWYVQLIFMLCVPHVLQWYMAKTGLHYMRDLQHFPVFLRTFQFAFTSSNVLLNMSSNA